MNQIIDFVKSELKLDNSGHNMLHIERVVSNALKIMENEGGNRKIIITACYLHDCVDSKLFSDESFQIKKIKTLLSSYNYNTEEINEIIDIITSISFSKNKTLNSLNAQIVRDADRLDALGVMGIIRTIEYGNSKNRPFYEEENIKIVDGKKVFNISTKTTLSHFYDKLIKLYDLLHTVTAKELAKDKIKIMEEFLDHFYKEI